MGTRDTIAHMPKLPMPKRSFRASDEDWDRVKWVADRRNVAISDVLRSGYQHEYEVELRKFRAEQRAKSD